MHLGNFESNRSHEFLACRGHSNALRKAGKCFSIHGSVAGFRDKQDAGVPRGRRKETHPPGFFPRLVGIAIDTVKIVQHFSTGVRTDVEQCPDGCPGNKVGIVRSVFQEETNRPRDKRKYRCHCLVFRVFLRFLFCRGFNSSLVSFGKTLTIQRLSGFNWNIVCLRVDLGIEANRAFAELHRTLLGLLRFFMV